MLACSRKAAKLFGLRNIKHSFEKTAMADTVRIPSLGEISEFSVRKPGKSLTLQFTLIPLTG